MPHPARSHSPKHAPPSPHRAPAQRGGAALQPPNRTGLPDALKAGVEALSGVDLSDVRVHRDSSHPAQLQALAYARGSEIHLAPGQERQLPHEAWHVVQQRQGRVPATQRVGGVAVNDDPALEREADQMGRRAASGPSGLARPAAAAQAAHGATAQRRAGAEVVQRAVGFEFETPYVIRKDVQGVWQPLDKMHVVKNYGNDILLTADERSDGNSVIEMVLDPPVQEKDPKQFASAVKTFLKVANAFDAVRKATGPMGLETVPGAAKGPAGYQVTPTIGGFTGLPQLTGGIRYDRLFDFLDAATMADKDRPADGHKAAKATLAGSSAAIHQVPMRGAETEVDKVGGSAELKGLVALLGIYLHTGAAARGEKLNYAKLIASDFMARTDFGSMFLKLPHEDLTQYALEPERFVGLVLAAAGMAGQGGAKVFERGIRSSDNKDSDDYDVDLTADTTLGLDITREAWLTAITFGQDPLSSAAVPRLKSRLMGLGALGGRTDRVGTDKAPAKGAQNKGSGIIVELRGMGKSGMGWAPQKFADTVQAIFAYLRALNTDRD